MKNRIYKKEPNSAPLTNEVPTTKEPDDRIDLAPMDISQPGQCAAPFGFSNEAPGGCVASLGLGHDD